MKENVEIPAAGLEPRGEITIEVFDNKTGELVTREKKENFVQQRLINAIFKMLPRYPMGAISSYYFIPQEYFNSVVLSDYAGAPDPAKENYIIGNQTAYGSKGYAAAGTTRGAWNANESIIRTDYVKLVFDFATSQGNGTFQSIYTTRIKEGFERAHQIMKVADLYLSNQVSRFSQMFANKLGIYMVSSDYRKIYKWNPFEMNFNSSQQMPEASEVFDWPTEGTSRYLSGGFAVRGNVFYGYYINYDSSNKIRKFTLGSTDAPTTAVELAYSPTGIFYDMARDRFMISETNKVHIYDNAFRELEVVEFPTLGTSWITGISDDGKTFLFYERIFDRETKKSSVITDSSGGSYPYLYMYNIGEYLLYTRDTAMVTMQPAPLFFSRALLDSPVTKTAQQNMKITYEFNVPTLNLLGP